MSSAIEFNHVGKQYRLGVVSTGTVAHDLNRWWQTSVLRREDPYLKIGSVNDRASKADSEYVWALRDIDFKVEQGDVVGIIGKNGAGKSTLLKLLSRVTSPTTGTIRAQGRIASLLEVGTGFHPEMTGRENIYMNGAILGMTKQEISRKLDEIIDFSGCERYIDTPVKRYSSGMMVRLGFAVAAHLDPEILVVDEVLAVGDAEFQKKAIGKMQDVSRGEGRTVLFVSHNMASMKALCHHGVLLENGMVRATGEIGEVVDVYTKTEDCGCVALLNLVQSNAFLRIAELQINGVSHNHLVLSQAMRKLHVCVAGECLSSMHLELEAELYDRAHVRLASYCPCHQLGRTNVYGQGAFEINETIVFPSNITNGEYLLYLYLTDPNIAYQMTLTQPIVVKIDGFVGDSGRELSYSERGLLVL